MEQHYLLNPCWHVPCGDKQCEPLILTLIDLALGSKSFTIPDNVHEMLDATAYHLYIHLKTISWFCRASKQRLIMILLPFSLENE